MLALPSWGTVKARPGGEDAAGAAEGVGEVGGEGKADGLTRGIPKMGTQKTNRPKGGPMRKQLPPVLFVSPRKGHKPPMKLVCAPGFLRPANQI